MRRELSPIVHKDIYSQLVEEPIVDYFREVIYEPLLQILRDAGVRPEAKDQGRENRKLTALEEALYSGQIWYSDGYFTGKFNAATSKELRNAGATWQAQRQVFRLPIEQMPFSLRSAVAESVIAAKGLHDTITRTLAVMQETIPAASPGLDFSIAVDKIVPDLQNQWQKSVQVIESIEVPAQFTPELRKTITETLTENSELSIKHFAAEQIRELRQKVEANVFAGYRTDRLAKIIEADYGVAKRKARFIAEQETSLLVAKYRQGRAESVGSQSYVWQTSHDERVRPDHRLLDGKQFPWSQPPICDRATGRRCHPGEDYNCRCMPRIIINYS